jgi:glycosyltransferase involved in cell wall biosynthesis
MRILHVSHELPPYELAGTGIYCLNIARAQALDHEVSIFARLQDPEEPPYRIHTEVRDGCTIRFVNRADLDWSPLSRSYEDPRAAALFRDFVEEVRPDIIHFQHVVGLGTGLLDVARSLGITRVFTLHDFWAMCPMGQRMCYTDHQICDPIDFSKCGPCVFGAGWKATEVDSVGAPGSLPSRDETPSFKGYYRRRYAETPGIFARRPRALLRAAQRSLRNRMFGVDPAIADLPHAENPFVHRFNVLRNHLATMDLLISPSAFLRDEFIEGFDLSPERMIHSANGMDFSYVKSLPKTPCPELRFGFMGSIIKTKGVQVLLDAFLEVASGRSDVRLEIHGSSNRWHQAFLDELKAKAAAASSMDRITFHGRYDNQRVGEVLQNIDVLVVPSIWFENAPLTLNEAAMTRTPIVVSDRGGMLEFVVANAYGRTFELGNPSALAAIMRELAEDRARIQELAGTPPPIKTVRDNADELLEIYTALAAGTYRAPTIEEQTLTRGGCVKRR